MNTITYAPALDCALRAARAAGDLLLRDLHRPGGPRGRHAKAPADEEAEVEIRSLLHEAFPRWGFVGEECRSLRRPPSDPEQHCWIVDPNDGTSSYLRGHRGSAVSIALLRAGRPVLGVVYAFAQDDLLAWAEGCGPLRRNGRPVPKNAWSSDLVLLSQSADRASEVNARIVAPRRFLAVPSIAWRMARAAAGDGVAGVSLSTSCGWDYAAAHALLLGVGGDLVDERGRSITYGPMGESHASRSFGGSPEVVRRLARLDWSEVFSVHHRDLARPKRDRILPNPGVLTRAQGCLLGQVAGDSLGSLVEFMSPGRIRARGGVRDMEDGGVWDTLAGQPTDDSEMALALARCLLREGFYSPGAAALAYAAWSRSLPFDMGSTTEQALSAVPADAGPHEAVRASTAAASRKSQANGSLMRISPLAVWGHALDPRELASLARRDSALTHPHPVCQDACAAFAVAVGTAIRTGSSPEETWRAACDWARREAHPDVTASLEAAQDGPPADMMTHSGWVRTALQNAFHRLLRGSLEDGVVDTVACGGDTDTNAAVAGALLGAVHGRAAVPWRWQSRILSCRPLPPAPQPRPREYWPVDVLILAEQLAVLGRRAMAEC